MDAQQMRTSRQQLIEEPTTLADRMVNGAGADAQPALEPDFWAVHSKTGVHIGLWPNKAHADEALREYEGGTITPLFRSLSSPDHADAGKSVEGDGWLPIESAPKDGTQILIEVHPRIFDVVSWSDGAWRECGNFMRLRKDPTHWRPLPTPPSGEVA